MEDWPVSISTDPVPAARSSLSMSESEPFRRIRIGPLPRCRGQYIDAACDTPNARYSPIGNRINHFRLKLWMLDALALPNLFQVIKQPIF